MEDAPARVACTGWHGRQWQPPGLGHLCFLAESEWRWAHSSIPDPTQVNDSDIQEHAGPQMDVRLSGEPRACIIPPSLPPKDPPPPSLWGKGLGRPGSCSCLVSRLGLQMALPSPLPEARPSYRL